MQPRLPQMETDPADRGWTTVRIDTETHRLLLLYHARLQAAKDSNYLRYPAYLCGRFPLGHAVRFLLDQQCRRNARRRAARGLARPRPPRVPTGRTLPGTARRPDTPADDVPSPPGMSDPAGPVCHATDGSPGVPQLPAPAFGSG